MFFFFAGLLSSKCSSKFDLASQLLAVIKESYKAMWCISFAYLEGNAFLCWVQILQEWSVGKIGKPITYSRQTPQVFLYGGKGHERPLRTQQITVQPSDSLVSKSKLHANASPELDCLLRRFAFNEYYKWLVKLRRWQGSSGLDAASWNCLTDTPKGCVHPFCFSWHFNSKWYPNGFMATCVASSLLKFRGQIISNQKMSHQLPQVCSDQPHTSVCLCFCGPALFAPTGSELFLVVVCLFVFFYECAVRFPSRNLG